MNSHPVIDSLAVDIADLSSAVVVEVCAACQATTTRNARKQRCPVGTTRVCLVKKKNIFVHFFEFRKCFHATAAP